MVHVTVHVTVRGWWRGDTVRHHTTVANLGQAQECSTRRRVTRRMSAM